MTFPRHWSPPPTPLPLVSCTSWSVRWGSCRPNSERSSCSLVLKASATRTQRKSWRCPSGLYARASRAVARHCAGSSVWRRRSILLWYPRPGPQVTGGSEHNHELSTESPWQNSRKGFNQGGRDASSIVVGALGIPIPVIILLYLFHVV